MTPMNHEKFMEIGPHVFEKSGNQTDTQTDSATLYIDELFLHIVVVYCV